MVEQIINILIQIKDKDNKLKIIQDRGKMKFLIVYTNNVKGH